MTPRARLANRAGEQTMTEADDIRRAAQALGRLAAGKPKRFSQAERERRRRSLAEARKRRWQK
jgi:hypothetical protein